MPAPSPGKKGKARAEGIPSPAPRPPPAAVRGWGGVGGVGLVLLSFVLVRGFVVKDEGDQKERWEDSGEGSPGTALLRRWAALGGGSGGDEAARREKGFVALLWFHTEVVGTED